MKSSAILRRAWGALLLATACVALAPAAAAAQRRDVPDNDPSLCPYCEGDPETMAGAGIVSHGGFEFATHDTAYVDKYLASTDIVWIESEHLEIGFALGPYKVPTNEKKKIRAELEELAELLPNVQPKKIRTLDPWLRSHMFALRAEKAYDRFLEIVQRKDEDFPKGESEWIIGQPYLGMGPYLGQKGKYEVLMLPSEALSVDFLLHEFGVVNKHPQRWNVVERDTLTVVMHAQHATDLRKDPAIHGHMVFNLAHNFLDGYKHYSYDTPVWIHEGLAHYMEREISPEFNSFDASEGGIANMTNKSKWKDEVHALVRKGEAPRLAELLAHRNYANFTLAEHFTTWSMITYLIERHPEGFAKILDDLTALTDEKGLPDGSNLEDHHRDAFKEHLGMSYMEFDQAWREWAMGLEPDPEDTAMPGPNVGGG